MVCNRAISVPIVSFLLVVQYSEAPMSCLKTYYIIRHGQYHYFGDDGPLTALGEEQARLTGTYLKKLTEAAGTTVDHFITSNKYRTMSTMQLIRDAMSGGHEITMPPIEVNNDWVEVSLDEEDPVDHVDHLYTYFLTFNKSCVNETFVITSHGNLIGVMLLMFASDDVNRSEYVESDARFPRHCSITKIILFHDPSKNDVEELLLSPDMRAFADHLSLLATDVDSAELNRSSSILQTRTNDMTLLESTANLAVLARRLHKEVMSWLMVNKPCSKASLYDDVTKSVFRYMHRPPAYHPDDMPESLSSNEMASRWRDKITRTGLEQYIRRYISFLCDDLNTRYDQIVHRTE